MAAQVYSLLRRTPWRHHSKLVMVTPDGLPLTMPEAALLPPLSRLSVQSMADFSRRLPPGLRLGQQVGRLGCCTCCCSAGLGWDDMAGHGTAAGAVQWRWDGPCR